MATNIVLDSYEFEINPRRMGIGGRHDAPKRDAYQETLTGGVLHLWGFVRQDQEITMAWDWMSQAMYGELRNRYIASNGTQQYQLSNLDVGVEGHVYNVIITALDCRGRIGRDFLDIAMVMRVLETVP
jgi:hypothetical protein